MNPRTPVFVLSGFLGSGKTTLLNRVLKTPAFANTAVIVNEFGEIGLDHLLIAQASDNVVLLDSGCLCCTIAESLHETLADLHFRKQRGELPPFERVIIETTGLADPMPILNTLLGNRLVTDHYCLSAVVNTVDAQHCLDGLARYAEVAKQLAVADRLVLTKLDLVELAPELAAALSRLNPNAQRLNASDPSVLRDAFAPAQPYRVEARNAEALRSTHEHHVAVDSHHHDVNRHDASIRADSWIIDDEVTWAGLAAWWRVVVDRFGDRMLRCKGLLRIADSGEIIFIQGVQRVFHRPERLPDWPDADHRSRLVCITRDVDATELRHTLINLKRAAGSLPEIAYPDLAQQRMPQ